MSARRRSPSAPRSSRATASSSRASSSTRCTRPRRARVRDERERLYRLRKTCESGLVEVELSEREDALENAILAARVEYRGEELPLRSAQAQLAVLPGYRDREELGELHGDASAGFNDQRMEMLRAREELDAELSGEPDAVARNEEEKGISLRELSQVLTDASRAADDVYGRLSAKWFDKLLGDEPAGGSDLVPRRLAAPALAARGDVHEGARDRGLPPDAPAPRLQHGRGAEHPLDLDDRPQKSPRACVIAADPPKVVHLITRAQGGLHDYQAFLHEAGHALHYGNCDPDLPYTFRNLSRDHALTEIYSYIFEAISREPGWHAEHFGLSEEEAAENAEATVFLEALLYRRYTAKLQFELEFWGNFGERTAGPARYHELLTDATRDLVPAGRVPRRHGRGLLLGRLPAGVDPLRPAAGVADGARSARTGGANRQTGDHLRSLFAEGTRPSSEEIAGRLGFDPHDTKPLLAELGA